MPASDAQMFLDMSVMTRVLNEILGVFEAGAGALGSAGAGLLSSLIIIEIAWAGLMWAFLDMTVVSREFLKKLMMVSVFSFFVLNWPTVANSILDGFIWAGMEVGGARGGISLMRDPSRILSQGAKSTSEVWAQVADLSLLSSDALIVILMAIISLAAMVMFFLIAINVFITLIEFYIITSFGVIFIPWGVNSHTKWIAERYFGAIVAQGTKVMVLTALLGVIKPVLFGLQLSEDPSLQDAMALGFGAATIAFVVFRAPSVAGGLMSGAASLQAGDMMAAGMAGGTMAASAAGTAVSSVATVATGGAAAPAAAAAAGTMVGSGSSVAKGVSNSLSDNAK